jgi:hypothetical protein
MPETPRRVTVTSSRQGRRAPSRARRESIADLHEQTELGGVLLRSLVRAQLTLAVGVLLCFGGFVAALPLAFAWLPHLAHRDVAGVPLPLVVLGVAIYPVVVFTGYVYVRLAERNERHFEELVRQS